MFYLYCFLYLIGYIISYFILITGVSDGYKGTTGTKLNIDFGKCRDANYQDLWLVFIICSVWPLAMLAAIGGTIYELYLADIKFDLRFDLRKKSNGGDE